MKRWISVFLSVTSLIAVTTVAMFAVATSKISFLGAAATPVYTASPSSDTAYTKDDYQDAKNQLQKQGIELSTTSSMQLSYASWTSPLQDSTDVLKAANLLKEEWLKYSATTIQKAGLKKIYLVKDLAVNGQYRSGMPEPIYEDALYFDVSSTYLNSEDGMYMRRTLHHEFKHLTDYNLYGSYDGDAKAWTSCNVTGISYGNGGGSMYNDPEYAHAVHPKTGFINGYATSAVEEDRAEVYAQLMTSPEKLQLLVGNDLAVGCKVNATRTDLAKL